MDAAPRRLVADVVVSAESVLDELLSGAPDAPAPVNSRHRPHRIAIRRTGPSCVRLGFAACYRRSRKPNPKCPSSLRPNVHGDRTFVQVGAGRRAAPAGSSTVRSSSACAVELRPHTPAPPAPPRSSRSRKHHGDRRINTSRLLHHHYRLRPEPAAECWVRSRSSSAGGAGVWLVGLADEAAVSSGLAMSGGDPVVAVVGGAQAAPGGTASSCDSRRRRCRTRSSSRYRWGSPRPVG